MERNRSLCLKFAFISIGIVIGLFSSLVTVGFLMPQQSYVEYEEDVEVSWITCYRNLKELAMNSSVIVLGKVIDAKTTTETVYEP